MKEIEILEKIKLSTLLEKQCNLPFYTANELISKRQIKVNGARIGFDCLLFKGDNVCIYFDFKPSKQFSVEFENEHIIILNKQKNAETCGIGSIEECLQLENKNLRACYRLDRNTDGFVIFAKSDEIEREIIRLQKEKKIKKTYSAIVSGKVKQSGEFTDYLFKDAEISKVFVSSEYQNGSKRIETSYKLIKKIDENLYRIEVNIDTGRTHQIRAHLAFRKIFILGDEKYGNLEMNKKYSKKMQELTLAKMEFLEIDGMLNYLSGKVFQK